MKLTGDNGVSDLEAIMDDNKEEIETSSDLKLIMGLSFSEVILSCIREGPALAGRQRHRD